MRILFQNDAAFNKMILVADTWMCLSLGEGEEEIANQGWSRVTSFSQETGAEVQHLPRIGNNEPKLTTKNKVQDARVSRNHLPFFSLQTMGASDEN